MQAIVLMIALAGVPTDVALAQDKDAIVEGTVRDTAGQALHDVQVWIRPADLKARTDSAGRYRLEAVPAGRAIVVTSLIGYNSAAQIVDLSPGDSVTLNFSVRPTNLPDGGNTVITVPMEQSDSR